MSGLLTLPPEVRIIILEACLPSGQPFSRGSLAPALTKGPGRRLRRRPLSSRVETIAALSLIQTCRTLSLEAQSIFFRRNIFRVALGDPLLSSTLAPRRDTPRSLKIEFSLVDLQPRDYLSSHDHIQRRFTRVAAVTAAQDTDTDERSIAMKAAHDYQTMLLQRVWDKLSSAILCLRLDLLTIDFTDCYCPLSCCRLAIDAARTLGPWLEASPARLKITGAQDEGEEHTIRCAIGGRLKPPQDGTNQEFS